jgi:hypothetical protein
MMSERADACRKFTRKRHNQPSNEHGVICPLVSRQFACPPLGLSRFQQVRPRPKRNVRPILCNAVTCYNIARTAGLNGGYQALFNANTDFLPSPNLLEVWQVLKIPCADGALPLTASTTTTTALPSETSERPDSLERPMLLVTASGYAPLNGAGQRRSGIQHHVRE